ncbi:MAG: DUF1684 domain-containing protein [Stenotrophomonas sp.]|uniref:DUF1684 domain-containing protein n=1 Tax=Stenotrophomonas sp. TaxID=69392 RepID=UPI003D6D41DB
MDFRKWGSGVLLLLALVACKQQDNPFLLDSRQYHREVEQWRSQRIARLRAPDGWLSYTGSGRVKLGSHRVGSAATNDIVLPSGPAQLGTLEVAADGTAVIHGQAGTGATLNGKPLRQATLRPVTAGVRDASRIQLGSGEFYLVRTGVTLGWRYRDASSPRRRDFRGIDYFPVETRWRVEAQWHPFPEPRHSVLLTSIGTPLPATLLGEAVFEINGRSHRLQPVLDEAAPASQRLFFVFTDRTSGRETYGGARYLYAAAPQDGKLVLDFNRAMNPPCALTPHVVCPIAPAANRLDLAVTAGEKYQPLAQ